MGRKAAVIGFLVIQAIVIAVWLLALLPLAQPGGPAFIGTADETFTGRIFSAVSFNFRSGETSIVSPRFNPTGPLLWATVLMFGAGLAGAFSAAMLRGSRTWISVAAALLALLIGLAAVWFIVEQWSGDTMFPAGSVGPLWLYAMARAFLLQFFIGFALLALGAVVVIAGFATPDRPLGFYAVCVNWMIVTTVWLASYLLLYVAPPLVSGGSG